MDTMYNLFPNLSAALDSFLRGFLPGNVVDVLMMLFSIIAILILLPVVFLVMTYLERKIVARIQDRWGPNRAGPWGIFQPFADMIKMFTKEDIVPDKADKIAHLLGPILVAGLPFIAFTVIPFGRGMNARDLDIGILFIAAVTSPGAIGILMAGWGSNNKYALLGGMRAVAQLISYEVPMVLSILVIVMLTGSLSMQKIVAAQAGPGNPPLGIGWFIFAFPIGPIAFLTYFISAVAETNRAPFDIPEAESELVAGYHTEYTGMKFGLFQMGEYVSTFAQSCIAATLFFGGWQGPILPSYVWFGLKVFVFIFIFMWMRGTLPRMRVDELMGFAWKFLVPVTLANIFLTGIIISLVKAISS
jgi:NADH-quinone oxidoreductase subunit H